MPVRHNICYCDLCGRAQHEVKKLIAGPTVFICDQCVVLCMDILTGDGFVYTPSPVTSKKEDEDDEPAAGIEPA